jgi:REP element-mobilizing transposase RayT
VNVDHVAAATLDALGPHTAITKTMANDNGSELQRDEPKQQEIRFDAPKGRGGRRPGAGRPRKAGRPSVAHRVRARLPKQTPLHVTLRCRREVGRLRRREAYRAVRHALAVTTRRMDAFRIVHVSIQRDHIHLIVEASDRSQLARGMQGFSVSCARQLNRRLGRSGPVFADRYHAVQLGSPRQVRSALSYLLNNWRHHGADRGVDALHDPFSSARAFDGWTTPPSARLTPGAELLPTAFARCWLLTVGWRRHRRIDPDEVPGGGRGVGGGVA